MDNTSPTTQENATNTPPVIQWGKPAVCPVQPLPDTGFSFKPTGNFLSVISTDTGLKLELQNAEQPLHAAQSAAFTIPVTIPDNAILVGYQTDLRFYVRKDAQSQIILTMEIGGTTRVFEFPYGEAREDVEVKQVPTKEGNAVDPTAKSRTNISRDMFSLQRTGLSEGAEHPVTSLLTATLLVSVQRQTPTSMAMVIVDTLDIQAVFGGTKPSE